MATGMAKIPLTKNKVFARSVSTRYILEGLVLKLCVYFISISCGTYMEGNGLTSELVILIQLVHSNRDRSFIFAFK